nr:hypothetical protein [uncultured Cohaesibacter sp.]
MTISIDMNQLIPAETKAARSVAEAKENAIETVTTKINEARASLMTDMIGQEMIYLAKEQEAKDWQAATKPDLANFPLLSAEVGITASSADELASLWLSMADQWRQKAASLEAIRLKAKADIGAAETADAVKKTLNDISW